MHTHLGMTKSCHLAEPPGGSRSSSREDHDHIACSECEEWQSSYHPRNRATTAPSPRKVLFHEEAGHVSHKIGYTQVSKAPVLVIPMSDWWQLMAELGFLICKMGCLHCIKIIKPRTRQGSLPPQGAVHLT